MPAWVDVRFRVVARHDGLRVDAFLAARLRACSRTEAQRMIDDGRVSLRGRPAKASARVDAGEDVVVRFPARGPEPPPPVSALEILHEDAQLVAVQKPAGILTHPNLRMRLASATDILSKQRPDFKPHPVHRLDRETSGVLVLAKTAGAARELGAQFARRGLRKEYLAVVSGVVAFEWRIVDAPLAAARGIIRVRQAVKAQGVRALTELERLAVAEDRSLVLAVPKTGRLHQIRVHLASLGHPVLGDKLYMGEGEAYLKAVDRKLTDEDLLRLKAPRQMLHAWRLSFTHPMTGASLTVVAPPPEDFRECAGGMMRGVEGAPHPGPLLASRGEGVVGN